MISGDALPVMLRRGSADDHALVYSTWLRSYLKAWTADGRTHGPLCGVAVGDYYKGQHLLIEELLGGRASLRVACSPEAPEQVFGYVVWSGRTVHWLYVKHPFRRFGLARRLLDGLEVSQYSHRVPLCAALPVPEGWRYSPWLAWTEAA